jgi:capsular exopolysaccharide synthesis family protein
MNLPEHSLNSRAIQRAAQAPAAAPPAQTIYLPAEEPEEVALPLGHYLWILRRHMWNILAFIAVAVFGTAAVSMRMIPVYQATTALYVDRQEAKGVVGQESQTGSYSSNDAEAFLASQIKLIQEDSVVRPVAEKYGLLEKEEQIQHGADAPLAKDAPIVLKRLTVTRPPNTYLIYISYRSPDRQLAADVANGIAASYIEHTYNTRIRSSVSLSKFMERQLEELRAKMEQSAAALGALEREFNVINPEEKTSILSSRLLQLNTEYTNAQADRVRKEAAYNSVRQGTLEAAQVSTQGEALKKLQERLSEAQEKFADVKSQLGMNHPDYRQAAYRVAELQRQIDATRKNIALRSGVEFQEAAAREQMIQKALAETKAEYDRLNLRSFAYQRAKREAEADKALYDELVKKIREAGINAGFQNNTVRIVNSARPPWKPVLPKPALNVALALLFSSILAVGAAILLDTLDSTIRDPEQAARTLKTRIIGTLPAVKNLKELAIRPAFDSAALTGDSQNPMLPVADRDFSTYDEAVRTIRSQMLLTDFDRRIKVLLFTSATAGEGKSTTASHLAWTHAEQKQRTLLIDCDLRRPSQHKMFGIPIGFGLSDVVTGTTDWRQVLKRPVDNPSLSIITSGPPNRRAADMMGVALATLLDEISQNFDLVVLDAPPLLGFSESLQLASVADGVVLVALAGKTDRKAVSAAVNTLTQLRANIVGLVLNRVKRHHSDHYYHYGYYGKYYKRYRREDVEA